MSPSLHTWPLSPLRDWGWDDWCGQSIQLKSLLSPMVLAVNTPLSIWPCVFLMFVWCFFSVTGSQVLHARKAALLHNNYPVRGKSDRAGNGSKLLDERRCGKSIDTPRSAAGVIAIEVSRFTLLSNSTLDEHAKVYCQRLITCVHFDYFTVLPYLHLLLIFGTLELFWYLSWFSLKPLK